MKLKRFVAKDMRTALTLVKDELGADAIIMSNKRIAAGVEIVAGIENLPQPRVAPQAAAAAAAAGVAGAAGAALPADKVGAPSANAPKVERERRLIGGKNQAYAKSLIEILERQRTMSQEQGSQLMNDIAAAGAAKAYAANGAMPQGGVPQQGMAPRQPMPQTPPRLIEGKTVPQGPMLKSPHARPEEPNQPTIQISADQAAAVAAQAKAAAAAAGFATSKSQATTLAGSPSSPLLEPNENLDFNDLGQQLSSGLFQNYSQEAQLAEQNVGAGSALPQDPRTASIPGAARILNPNASINGDDDDMANDPSKKAGPSTIDPSLDEDADLFKTPPLPLSQQREFKNFFVKSKARQEKEDYESREGIDSYRGPGEPNVRQDLEKMRAEVENIRKLLQFELAGLMQDNRSRTEPVKAMTIKLLHSVGFSDRVSDLLVKNLPAEATFNTAWRSIVQALERSIVVGDDEIISQGGIVTLIGPAGVGKTTTLAKLAARFVMRYGPQRVAIVTADHYRIGAVEQIKTYGRIMGCATFAVKNLSELPQLLYTMSDKSLILVDTAGVGFKDERFGAQLSQLKLQSTLKLKHYLVLPCTAQRKVLQHAYDHFSIVGLTGLILTKLDECQNLGDALSLCIDMNLPISYITDGQRVPEDIDVPHPNELARRALSSIEDDMAQKAIKA